jgi:hypothetical protein
MEVMHMETSTHFKARAAMALVMAIFCGGCELSADDPDSLAAGDGPAWPDDSIRVQETDLDTTFSKGWVHANTAHDWSGGTAASSTRAGAEMSFSFTGTRIRWIGWRESGAGAARVSLDGKSLGRVDLYSNTIRLRTPVFTSQELAEGPHTLTIRVIDANPASSGTMVVVDAFDIVSDTPRPRLTRSEENAPAVSFTGVWNVDSGCVGCSGGRDSYAHGPDSLASFEFTGTRVRWLGWLKDAGGIANVYLDGAFAAEVDLQSTTLSAQAPLFTSEVLQHGPHTLLIEATGTNSVDATGSVVSVDAFVVARDN